jgi:tetratricopeptide (TPR) repeat protein
MAEEANEISEQEKQQRNEMLFTLSDRDRGTLAMIVTGNEWKRKELYRFLKAHLQEYIFTDIDLTPHNYTSLFRAMQELLPENIQQSDPVRYLISVTGLESSLYKTGDGKIEFSALIAQLNFERELIYNQPYIILLWTTEGFDKELQKKAPDLMHWMSKRFVFNEDRSDGFEVAEEAISYGLVNKQGKIPERLERIRQLQETWEKLCLYNEDQARLIKDKINLLRLLGKEYGAAFDFASAEEAFKKAIALGNKIESTQRGELFYELSELYYDFKKYELALTYSQMTFDFAERSGSPDLADIYHMIGMSFQGNRKWGEALQNYRQALELKIKAGNEYDLGNTYHQIGRVYEEQHKWGEALRNYQQALDWYGTTGNEYKHGNTYHQIGRVYEQQNKWEEALKNYQQALEWYRKTGNDYEMGDTYHQIGRVYEQQNKWEEALKNYQQALDLKIKTSNEYGLGITYHQTGMVYQGQREWEEALKNYQQALDLKIKTGNEYAIGNTYYQIAQVFKDLNRWDEALRFLQQALESYKKTNNQYEIGDVYEQIGRVYEEKGDFRQALEFYNKAIENLTLYEHPNLHIAQESAERIHEKLNNQAPNIL